MINPGTFLGKWNVAIHFHRPGFLLPQEWATFFDPGVGFSSVLWRTGIRQEHRQPKFYSRPTLPQPSDSVTLRKENEASYTCHILPEAHQLISFPDLPSFIKVSIILLHNIYNIISPRDNTAKIREYTATSPPPASFAHRDLILMNIKWIMQIFHFYSISL